MECISCIMLRQIVVLFQVLMSGLTHLLFHIAQLYGRNVLTTSRDTPICQGKYICIFNYSIDNSRQIYLLFPASQLSMVTRHIDMPGQMHLLSHVLQLYVWANIFAFYVWHL